MRALTRLGAIFALLGGGASKLWAHSTTSPHIHAGEMAGLVIVSLLVVGMLVLWANGNDRSRRIDRLDS
jgi:hypothetical protein